MNKNKDLEISALCCILLKPELMETTKLEDKHFENTQRIWQFMKAFYKKFKCFDIELMASSCKDNFRMMNYITTILESEATWLHFELYEKKIIENYEEEKKDKWIIKEVFKYANELYLRNMTTGEFKKLIDEIYEKGNERGK